MVNAHTPIFEFLRELSFFSGLPEEDLSAFFQHTSIRDVKKHQSLFHQGDKVDRFIIIYSGWVKLFRHTTEGEEVIISLISKGDILGETAVIAGSTYPFSAEIAEDAKLIEISGAFVRERALQNHNIMSHILSHLSRELRNVQMENEHLAIMSAPQRVGCFLLQLSSHMLGAGGTFSFPYDKSLAAARLGMKAETFSRALTQLKPLGVTVKGPEVTIDNFSNLVGYVCNHCSYAPGDCRDTDQKNCENVECRMRTN